VAELVGIQPGLDSEIWIGFPAEVIKAVCIKECGEDEMGDCWGDDGPQPGQCYECTSCYCQAACTHTAELGFIEPEVVRG